MKYWLVKSEPDTYSWEKMVKDGTTFWDGVRNYQAANNMKAMKKGDSVFFYHSNKGKEIVGIVTVVREYYPDPSDKSGRFGMVDVKVGKPFNNPVSLQQLKEDGSFDDIALIRQSRLSVMPIDKKHWDKICKMGGVK